jgi:hypothetical protein
MTLEEFVGSKNKRIWRGRGDPKFWIGHFVDLLLERSIIICDGDEDSSLYIQDALRQLISEFGLEEEVMPKERSNAKR